MMFTFRKYSVFEIGTGSGLLSHLKLSKVFRMPKLLWQTKV